MAVFWHKGYAATSIQDLVEATGVNRASLYGAFGDKHRLFLAAIDRYAARSKGERLALLERPGPVKPLIRAFFDDLIVRTQGEGRCLGCLLTNSAVELAPHDPLIRARLRDGFLTVEQGFEVTLRRGQRTGEIAPEKDPKALARFLLGLVQGLRVLARSDAEEATLRDIVEVGLRCLD